jgi:hypothetical protein
MTRNLTTTERDILRWATDNGSMPQPGTEAYDEMQAAVERVPELLGTINRMRAILKDVVESSNDRTAVIPDYVMDAVEKELSDNPPAGRVEPIPADVMLQRRTPVSVPDWIEAIDEMKPVHLSASDVAMAILAYEEGATPYALSESRSGFYTRMLRLHTPQIEPGQTVEPKHRVIIADGMMNRHEVPNDPHATLILRIQPTGNVLVLKDRYNLFGGGREEFEGKVVRQLWAPVPRTKRRGSGRLDSDMRADEPLKALRKTARMLSRARKANAKLSNIYAAVGGGSYEPSEDYDSLIYELQREAGTILLDEKGGILMGYLAGFEQIEDERNQLIAAVNYVARSYVPKDQLKNLVEGYPVLEGLA